MKHCRNACLILACAAAVGCPSEDQVNLGDSENLGASLSDYAGTWNGYAEAFKFNDGTDGVRLSLDDDGTGVLEFGDAAKLPPPEEDKGYPPSVTNPFEGRVVVAGFSYPVNSARIESRRIKLATTSGELYEEWCSLLPPVEQVVPGADSTDEPYYACIDAASFSMDTTNCTLGGKPIDCGRLSCPNICTCDADACAVAEAEDDIELDGALQDGGRELAGTLVLQGQRINVRMTRD